MNIGQAIASFFKNYANFKGRARRSEYWWVALFIGVVSLVLQAATAHVSMVDIGGTSVAVTSYSPIYYVWLLAILVPGLALIVRRLHDTGRKGTYYFMILIPVVGGILMLIRLAEDSQPGANAYGEPVK